MEEATILLKDDNNLNCPESKYKSTDEETTKSNGEINEKMDDDDEIEGGDEINEDLTDKSETITSSLETTSSLERVSSKSITEESEVKGMETDDDVEENLPDDDTTSEKKNGNVVQDDGSERIDPDDDEEEKINENIQEDDENEKDHNDEEEKGKTQEQQMKTDKQSNKGSKIEERVIDENQKNIAKDESQKKKTDEDQINQNDETSDSQIKVNNGSDQHDDQMDNSTCEKEFTQFLTQTPEQFEEAMEDGEKGIIINDQDIIKPEDVFGRGKRCRTPKTDTIYTSDYDPDFDPKQETRPRRFVIESRRSQAKQTSDSPKKAVADTATPLKKQRFPNLNIDALELPASYGWRREVVVRNTYDDNKRRPADVYYKPPTGKKLRSMVEISSHLRNQKIKVLTEINFSFIKTPISKPPFETVRNAGKALGIGKRSKPEIVIEKDSDEPAVPFNGNCDEVTQSKVVRSPRGRKRKRSCGPGQSSSKFPALEQQLKKPVPEPLPPVEGEEKTQPVQEMQLQIKTEPVDPDEQHEEEEEKEATFPECPPTLEETRKSPTMSPPKKKSKSTARKSTTQKWFKSKTSSTGSNNKLEPLCSLQCPGLFGKPPTLQCNGCLCMFHPKCVNFGDSLDSFICLRCFNKTCSPGSDGLLNVQSPPTTVVFPTTKSNLIPLNTFLASSVVAPITKSSTIATVAPSTSSTTSSVAGVKIKREPVDYDENQSTGSKASSDVIGNVRSFLERKATDINQNQSSGQYPLLKEGLQRPGPILVPTTTNLLFVPAGSFPNTGMTLVAPRTLLQSSLPFGSIPSPMLHNSIPGAAVRPVISFPVVTDYSKPVQPPPKLSISSPVSLQPPRLMAAPGTKSHTTPVTTAMPDLNGVKTDDSCTNKQGQLLTLPPVVIKRLNLNQPVSLKINNTQVTVPPSSFLHTAQGLKLFLPKNTFPVNTGETAKLSVTVTNDKTLSLVDSDNNTNSSDATGQLPTIVPNSSRTVTEDPTDTPRKRTRQCKYGINPSSCFIQHLYGGFDCMLKIFEYLNLCDLFKVSSVCRTWRKLAMQQYLWREVRLKNMMVNDWGKAAKYLSRRAVEVLNLRGLHHYEDRNRTWHQLISVIHQFSCVHTIHFGAVPGTVLQTLCEKMLQLEELSAEWISDLNDEQMQSTPTKVDIGKFSSLTNLRVLKLRGIAGLTLPAFSLSGGLSDLKGLKNLQKLSITSLKEVGAKPDLEFLTALTNLTHLELGDCTSWTKQTYESIGKLTQLKSLRLECGGNSYDTGLADALDGLRQLENLELIEFLIGDDLIKILQKLDKLKSLKVWPDMSSQPAAQVNSLTLYTITQLKSLRTLEWGILSNKDSSIILDGEDSNKQMTQNNQEWIPILPASDNGYDPLSESLTEYISLSNFKEKLAIFLPRTKLNVFSTQTVSRNEEDS